MLGIGEKEVLLLAFSFSPSISSLKALRKYRDLDWGMTSHKMVLYVFKKDELLFLTYQRNPYHHCATVSMSFVPCQVTLQGMPTRRKVGGTARHLLLKTKIFERILLCGFYCSCFGWYKSSYKLSMKLLRAKLSFLTF